MAEPTVEVPARLVLIALKYMSQTAKYFPSHKDMLLQVSDGFTKAVVEQIGGEDLDEAMIAAKIQESG